MRGDPRGDRDTLVIFTSDNGADLNARERGGSSGPLLCGKQSTFEGGEGVGREGPGMRTPTIAWWRHRRPARQVVTTAATHMDLLPTLAEVAGAALPAGLQLDGGSIAALLEGREGPHRPVYYYRGNLLYAVRLDQHKVQPPRAPGLTWHLAVGPGS